MKQNALIIRNYWNMFFTVWGIQSKLSADNNAKKSLMGLFFFHSLVFEKRSGNRRCEICEVPRKFSHLFLAENAEFRGNWNSRSLESLPVSEARSGNRKEQPGYWNQTPSQATPGGLPGPKWRHKKSFEVLTFLGKFRKIDVGSIELPLQ